MQENPHLQQNSKISTCLLDKIKDHEKRRKNVFSGEILYSRHLVQCDRRILYRVYGTHDDQSSMMQEYSDKFMKEKWINILNSIYSLEMINSNFQAADANYNLTSNVDCIVKVNDVPVVVMIEGLSEEEYLQPDLPSRSSVVDITMQMWMLELCNGLIIIENRNNLEYIMYHIIPYVPIVSSCKKKCLKLMEFKICGKMPERPYGSSDNKECSICEFHKTCWQNK